MNTFLIRKVLSSLLMSFSSAIFDESRTGAVPILCGHSVRNGVLADRGELDARMPLVLYLFNFKAKSSLGSH